MNVDEFKIDQDWRAFYGGVVEALPSNVPKLLSKDVILQMIVDSDHAGDKADRRSRTEFMIFLNMAMINWYTKKQPTIEGAVFGAEFVAMKTGVETLRGLRYKFGMMSAEIDGPKCIYCDDQSVISNTSKPESVLKKKSISICYAFVREAVAMKECLTTHLPTLKNYTDMLTKILYGEKQRDLVEGILHFIYHAFGNN